MRGDQLARQWRVIRAIEASPNGLTVAEIAKWEETRIRTIYRDLEALQAAGFPLYTEKVERATRWAFIDTFKFKIPPPFTLTELMSLYFYKDTEFVEGSRDFPEFKSEVHTMVHLRLKKGNYSGGMIGSWR
jgi:hypothetical protein